MNEEFITKGIENDRYLKAVRLAEQFEEEMFTTLENVLKEIIKTEPTWFFDEHDYNFDFDRNKTRSRTEPLGHIRVDHYMERVNETGDKLRLQFCIEWTQPEVHLHDEHTDGALCIVFYKIKDLDRAEYEKVRQQTRQADRWDAIQFDDDVWSSDYGLFYIPVDTGPAIKEAFETLSDHFLEFGDEYGELLNDEGGSESTAS